MNWTQIRQTYINQWLIIEALEASTTVDEQRELRQIAVIDHCTDGSDAMKKYRDLHQQYPHREFYFVHTSREQLDIRERHWLGMKKDRATDTKS